MNQTGQNWPNKFNFNRNRVPNAENIEKHRQWVIKCSHIHNPFHLI